MYLAFILTNSLLGAGLAMDAFSVSMANGLHEPWMSKRKMRRIAGTYAFFQFAMPLLGWLLVHSLLGLFRSFQPYIPWIALFLLLYIGGNMLWEGIRNPETEKLCCLGRKELLLQGIATSIDALSVGVTIADYRFIPALAASLLIAAVTYLLCRLGLKIGKRFGTALAGKASILGGLILIGIGIEIFVSRSL